MCSILEAALSLRPVLRGECSVSLSLAGTRWLAQPHRACRGGVLGPTRLGGGGFLHTPGSRLCEAPRTLPSGCRGPSLPTSGASTPRPRGASALGGGREARLAGDDERIDRAGVALERAGRPRPPPQPRPKTPRRRAPRGDRGRVAPDEPTSTPPSNSPPPLPSAFVGDASRGRFQPGCSRITWAISHGVSQGETQESRSDDAPTKGDRVGSGEPPGSTSHDP